MIYGLIAFSVALIGIFLYCVVYGAASTRSPEYQKQLDDEQLDVLSRMSRAKNSSSDI